MYLDFEVLVTIVMVRCLETVFADKNLNVPNLNDKTEIIFPFSVNIELAVFARCDI